MTAFARRLAEERLAAGLTARELARRAGVDHRTVNRYEDGELDAASGAAKALADALGVRVEDLFDPEPVFVDVHVDAELPTLDRMAADGRRIARWPDSRRVYRVRLLGLPDVLSACDGSAAMVTALIPARELSVIVEADTRTAAIQAVLRDTTPLGSCPPVAADRIGNGHWRARLRHVHPSCSIRLQSRIPRSSPVGLYIPAV